MNTQRLPLRMLIYILLSLLIYLLLPIIFIHFSNITNNFWEGSVSDSFLKVFYEQLPNGFYTFFINSFIKLLTSVEYSGYLDELVGLELFILFF